METREHNIITNGPSKMDVMLGMFDQRPMPSNEPRVLVFKVRELVGDRFHSYDMRVVARSVTKRNEDEWQIEGVETEHEDTVTLYYSTRTRKGTFKVGPALKESGHIDDIALGHFVAQVTGRMGPSTCDWCNEPIGLGNVHMTEDGEDICDTCYQVDQKGKNVAWIGRLDPDEVWETREEDTCQWCEKILERGPQKIWEDGSVICDTCYDEEKNREMRKDT